MTYHVLGPGDLALAAALLLVNVVLSLLLRLGLVRGLVVSASRMVVQLLLVGYALAWIFALASPFAVLAVAFVMATVAAHTAVQNTSRQYPGVFLDALAAILGASAVVIGVVLLGIVRPTPWFAPQVAVPLLGMIMGNALNGVTLALDRFAAGLEARRDLVETLLALGATRWEAAHGEVRLAMRTGMIPTINGMAVTGIVSLPGMMTGQILAGASPVDAVRYQIMVMFMLAAATALATLAILVLAFRVLFDGRDRLRLDRLAARRGER